ncbi:secretory phospholipase A2 receptor-like [Engraulis encrasicolus]|uniref:secretory phospholipase A2 receptor-like n=1 Tax=Engraulis encrasicolus TaxID=184585 RepID=UPI002FD1E7EF
MPLVRMLSMVPLQNVVMMEGVALVLFSLRKKYWGPFIPNNQGKDNCAGAWLTDGDESMWGDRKCDEQHPFFCRSDDLVLVSQELTWREAFAYCGERDMYLVSIFTEEMEQRVMEVAKAASTSEVWVGLRYLCVLEMWIWSTGETVCYDNWAPEGQVGMEKCREWQQGRTGAVKKEGRWVSRPENEKLNFICATRDAM